MSSSVTSTEKSAARAAARKGEVKDWMGTVSGRKEVHFDEQNAKLTVAQEGGTHRRAALKSTEERFSELEAGLKAWVKQELEAKEVGLKVREKVLEEKIEAREKVLEGKIEKMEKMEGVVLSGVRRIRAHKAYLAVAGGEFLIVTSSSAFPYLPALARSGLRSEWWLFGGRISTKLRYVRHLPPSIDVTQPTREVLD